MKYLKDKDAAQDAVQQVFLKVLTHLPSGEINNFKGWLYILMRNHCLQLLRDKVHTVDSDEVNIIAQETDKEALLQSAYTLEQMNEALTELAEEQKNTIVLFYLKKLSYQQIMEQTGYTFMQVKSHIQNGKRNLRTILLKKLGQKH